MVDDIHGNNQNMMQDQANSKTWKYYIAIATICLISGVIGGLIAVALVPRLYLNSSQTAQTTNSNFTPVITQTDKQPIFPVEQIAKNVGPAVVGISNLQSGKTFNNSSGLREVESGSGFIIDAQMGYVVTNNHVIDGAQKITASLSDGRILDVKLVGADPLTDLAVLQVSDRNNLIAVNLGDSTKLIVGEPVVAIGNPGGNEFAGSVTTGVVSALNRSLNIQGESGYDLIQTDAAINPGNSGGPLVDYQGLVIGITTVKFAVTGFEGISFAIPISTAIPTVQQLINTGVAKHPGLMVSVNDQYVAYAISNNLPLGAYIAEVAADGPAAKAGIMAGDVITKINEVAISNSSDLIYQIYKYQVGDDISVTYLRNEAETQVQVILGEISSTQ